MEWAQKGMHDERRMDMAETHAKKGGKNGTLSPQKMIKRNNRNEDQTKNPTSDIGSTLLHVSCWPSSDASSDTVIIKYHWPTDKDLDEGGLESAGSKRAAAWWLWGNKFIQLSCEFVTLHWQCAASRHDVMPHPNASQWYQVHLAHRWFS